MVKNNFNDKKTESLKKQLIDKIDSVKKELLFAINQRKREIKVCFNSQKMKNEKKAKEENKSQIQDYKGKWSDAFDCEYLITNEELFQKGLYLIKENLV